MHICVNIEKANFIYNPSCLLKESLEVVLYGLAAVGYKIVSLRCSANEFLQTETA